MKVLLDTDIGSDIDDAVCLAYLLAQPKCELLGITTVSGNTIDRAKLASVLCKAAHQDIPIYPGTRNPLVVAERQPYVPQASSLSRWDHLENFEEYAAVDFLRRTIRETPGEITLLTIGPLTNIALLFSIDPDIPRMLKGIVMMAGLFFKADPRGEWNIWCDPHAASIVYQAKPKSLRSLGLDVTTQCVMSHDQVKRRFFHPLLLPVVDFAGAWFEHSRDITFHDPLTAVSIFDDNVCKYIKGTVEVVPVSTDPAATIFHKDPHGRHQVASEVNVPLFFDSYFSVF
jgi:inosine-uridine nucleoside N-ribohydrolase